MGLRYRQRIRKKEQIEEKEIMKERERDLRAKHRNRESVRGEEKKEKMTERGRDIDTDTK
jgi:hypothetical protein